MRIPEIKGAPAAALAALNRRIQSMNDEDKVANLHNAYGYYTDRKMWDDASDLFTDDGVLEIADVGIYAGVKSIRRSYERFGPQGLQHGQLNDRPIFNLLVSVSAAGNEARTRGVEFNMLGDFGTGTASLGLDVLESRFVRGTDGIWRIREMRVFPIMATDYYRGWAKSRLVTPPPTGTFAPDKPVPAADAGTLTDGAIPVFFESNPVTGKPVTLPAGAKFAGVDALVPALAQRHRQRCRRRATLMPPSLMPRAGCPSPWRMSRWTTSAMPWAISSTTSNGIRWACSSRRTAGAPRRPSRSASVPSTLKNVSATMTASRRLPRASASGHWLIQPVIDVAPDGTSAKMRHRLLHIDAAPESRGFSDGMYPNNAAKLENGVWKFDVAAPDQPYFSFFGLQGRLGAKVGDAGGPRREQKRHRAAAELPARCAACLHADPSSRLVAWRHDRVAGHQADVVFLQESGQRPCAAPLLPGPQDLRNGSQGGGCTALNRGPYDRVRAFGKNGLTQACRSAAGLVLTSTLTPPRPAAYPLGAKAVEFALFALDKLSTRVIIGAR